MKIEGMIAVVTGGANGIGRALCKRFDAEGASKVIVADLREADAKEAAREFGGIGFGCDVGQEAQVASMIEKIENEIGPIDLFCSNAGVLVNDTDPSDPASCPDRGWQLSWQIHVMAHVYAARALGPRMAARGHGYFLQTISAAGLLTQIGSGPYSATKHAAVGFAESLAIAYRDRGVKVSILCPQGVQTAMVQGAVETPAVADGLLSPDDVAECAIAGLADERFLILPHPQVAEYMKRKSGDYDRWLSGMARLRNKMGHK